MVSLERQQFSFCVQGREVKLTARGAAAGGVRRGGGRRGCVSDFSRASRRRMLSVVAHVDWEKYIGVVFLTLTYDCAHFPDSPEDCKGDLNRFLMRVRRAFPAAAGLWRFEYASRGERAFHPHYHLLLGFTSGDVEIIAASLRSFWDHGFTVARVASGSSALFAARYVSKYMVKSSDDSSAASGGVAVGSPEAADASDRGDLITAHISTGAWSSDTVPARFGRFWGVFNRAGLLVFPVVWLYISEADFFSIRRVFRALLRSYRLRSGRRRRPWAGWRVRWASVSLLTASVFALTLDDLGALLGRLTVF